MVFSARGDFSVFSDFAGHQCYQPGSISTFALFQPQKWATLSNQFWTCHEHGCHWVPGYEMIWAWVKNGQNMSKFHIPRIPTGSFVPPCQVSSAPSLFVPWGLMFASSWRMRCAAPSTAWESDKGCLGNWNGWSPAKKQSLEDGFPVQSLIVRVAMLLFALLVFALVFNIDGDSKKHSSMTHIILLVWIVFNHKEQCVNRRRFWIPPNWAVAACFLVFFLCYTTLTSFFSFFPVIIFTHWLYYGLYQKRFY